MISDISHFNHVWDDDSTHAFVSGVLAPFHHGLTVILGQVAIPPSPGARYIHDIPTVNALSSASLGALGAWPGLGPPAYVPPVMPLAPGSPQMASPQRAPMSAVPQMQQVERELGKLGKAKSPFLVQFSIKHIET